MKEININDYKYKFKMPIFWWVVNLIGAINWLGGSFMVFYLKMPNGIYNLIIGGVIMLFCYIDYEFTKLRFERYLK